MVVFSICKISKIANLIVTKRSSINVTLYFGNKLNSQCQIYVLLTWDSPSCLSWSIIEFWNMGMKNKFVVYMGMWGLPPFIFWMNLFSSALGILVKFEMPGIFFKFYLLALETSPIVTNVHNTRNAAVANFIFFFFFNVFMCWLAQAKAKTKANVSSRQFPFVPEPSQATLVRIPSNNLLYVGTLFII